MEGPSLFGGPNEYEGFCMWRAYPSPPLSATRMRISASCLYIARCYFGNQLVLQSSDLEGSYNTDPGHGYSGSWFVFLSVCLFSKPAPNLNYVCAPRLLVLLVGACPLLSPQGLAPLLDAACGHTRRLGRLRDALRTVRPGH